MVGQTDGRFTDGARGDDCLACGPAAHSLETLLHKYRLVVEHTSNMVVITDAQRRIEYVNPAYSRVTGWGLDEVIGRRPSQLLHGPQTDTEAVQRVRGWLDQGVPVVLAELLNYTKSGQPYWAQLNIQPVHDAQGVLTHFVAIQSDVTQQRAAREALQASERRLAEAQRLARMASFECEGPEQRLWWTPAAADVLGVDEAALPVDLAAHVGGVHPDDRATLEDAYRRMAWREDGYEVEYRLADAQGRARWVRERGYLLPAEGAMPSRLCALLYDISSTKAAQDRMAYLAWYDALTGLANREQLQALLQVRMDTSRQNGRQLAVLFIDLDRFKTINDSLGHHVGDEVLKVCGQRLRTGVRSNDLVARLSGDEFVIVLTDIADAGVVASLGTKILAALSAPMRIEGRELHVSGSLGVGLYPQHGDTVSELMRHADAAMYQAKAQGRNTLVFYTPEMHAHSARRFELESKLRLALPRREFSLHFQPQYRACDRSLVGFEALLRWHTEVDGWVPPDQFIPLAEEAGLIHQIGDWVLDEACRQWRRWAEHGHPGLRVAVNLSAYQLRDPALASRVAAHCERHGLPPDALELELTESVAMHDPRTSIQHMTTLRERGVCWAVDDFGTGYSSLAYLKTLPIERIKLDRAFVNDIEHNPDDRAICAAAIQIAHALGLELVAEGVENEQQLHYLAAQGCDVMQGYHLGRPMPADAALALVCQAIDPAGAPPPALP
ncbi:MAG: EAL domain-containing protein [Proteobacteria bacterium]|uniref:sensor domain-containing protein n=1 Tax=Aquabacterium sp. TaxID=1872578 RepID=UPI0035C776C4|nr:EAL domain-containing protein [Pseudomonadota bacterium]